MIKISNKESNYPTAQANRQLQNQKGFVSDTVRSIMTISKGQKPKSEEELKERIAEYFNFCAASDFKPGIESLSLSLGIDRTTFWRWCNQELGVSESWSDTCKQARQAIVAFVEACANSGHLSPPIAIFSLKNLANWKDSISFEDVTPFSEARRMPRNYTNLPMFMDSEEVDHE